MSATTGVLRWSALGLGVIYGVYHQATISSRDKIAAVNREYDHKLALISQAKEEYAKKQRGSSGVGGVITDPMDPKFDLEAYLKASEK